MVFDQTFETILFFYGWFYSFYVVGLMCFSAAQGFVTSLFVRGTLSINTYNINLTNVKKKRVIHIAYM